MHTNKTVTQIAPSIWRVDRFTNPAERRKSLFVTEPNTPFVPNESYCCTETPDGMLQFQMDHHTVLSEIDSPFTQGFLLSESDGIYGLGIHQKLPLNRRNTVCQMVQKNGEITAVPFFTSTGGYAVLFDTCAYMSIGIDKPCTTEYTDSYEPQISLPNEMHIFADDADFFSYYVILGRTIDEQIAGYRLLTGKSPMFAKWTYGFFQSREHYKTQQEVLFIAHEFRDRHIPLDCIVQDWNYWGDLGWNAVEWDHKKYPDPKAMVDELHNLDIKLMISVWPSFGPQTNICKELEEADAILAHPDRKKEVWGRVHDPLNEKAADIVWKYMNQNLFSIGVDAWWLDSTEPSYDIDSSMALLCCQKNALGENRRYLNHFALCTGRNVYRRQRAESTQKRVYILTRSGYAGWQASGNATWTGDIRASFDVFKQQISSLLSFSASGIPYSTTDIGAFFVSNDTFMAHPLTGGNQNEEYRELYTRWFWFGAFSPLFRSHGTDTPREMWFFGEPGTPYYDSQLRASKLRYALMPYLYAAAFDVYENDQTLMRPLVMDFPEDAHTKEISDSYLFGPSLLVHMITSYQQRTADVYLPDKTDWVDFFTGTYYKGGQTVTVDAPIDQIPIFVKAGSLIWMTEPADCTAQQDEHTLKLFIYPGADCTAFYYQDDGDNYSYESGNYVKIPVSWNEATRTLTFSAAIGNTAQFDCRKTIEIYENGKYKTTTSYCADKYTLSL